MQTPVASLYRNHGHVKEASHNAERADRHGPLEALISAGQRTIRDDSGRVCGGPTGPSLISSCLGDGCSRGTVRRGTDLARAAHVEVTEHGQALNFDIVLTNRGEQAVELTRLEVTFVGADGDALTRRLDGNGTVPAIEAVPERQIKPRRSRPSSTLWSLRPSSRRSSRFGWPQRCQQVTRRPRSTSGHRFVDVSPPGVVAVGWSGVGLGRARSSLASSALGLHAALGSRPGH